MLLEVLSDVVNINRFFPLNRRAFRSPQSDLVNFHRFLRLIASAFRRPLREVLKINSQVSSLEYN